MPPVNRLGSISVPTPLVRVNFQQQRMPHAAVDDVDLADALVEHFQAGLDLGDHARFDRAAGDHFAGLRRR